MRINSLREALYDFPDIDGYWQGGDLAAIEGQILTLLPPQWATDWSPRTMELLTQLSRAQSLQGKLPEARSTLEQSWQMISEYKGALDPRTEIRWLLEQGRMFCLAMSPAKAQDLFQKAFDKATAENLPYFAIDAALMLSTIRPPKFQNEWLQKALKLAESTEDPAARQWLAQLLFLNGWHEFNFRQFEEALANFERALALPAITSDVSKYFALRWSRARTLRALGKTEEAHVLQEELLADMQKFGKVNGHVYLEIAECKQLMKQKEEAKTYFELAYTSLSADGWYSDNKTDELERMKYLYKKR